MCNWSEFKNKDKNLFSKEESIQQTISHPSHLFSIRRFFFQNCSRDEVVQQSSLFYRFNIIKNQCHHLHNKNLRLKDLYTEQVFCQATLSLFARKYKLKCITKRWCFGWLVVISLKTLMFKVSKKMSVLEIQIYIFRF